MTQTPTATEQLRDAIQRVLNDAQTAWEQLRPTLNALADTGALPPTLAEDLRRQAGSVPDPAPVVVGGRYVVGENPTFAGGARCVVAKPDDVVTITRSEPDEDGDVGFRRLQNGQSGWIQPRHLTPYVEPDADAAPEPAAPPAVDDDLLRDLHRAAGVGSAWSTKPEEWADRLLASEPMQRLRAAWTAEVKRERDEALIEVEGAVWRQQKAEQHVAELADERNALRTELNRTNEPTEEDAIREFLMGTSVYGGLTDERGVAGYARQIIDVLNAHRARGEQDQPRGHYVGQHIDINLNGQEADQ